MCDYEHHLFISYRRSDKLWTRWARENVADGLKRFLLPAFGDVSVFVDDQIEAGSPWPNHLARALARSRLLVPLLCRDYFRSQWCTLELKLMMERQRLCGLSTGANDTVLIIPFVYDDDESFPPEIRAIQSEQIHVYANPYVRPDTPNYEPFSEFLKASCEGLKKRLKAVPAFDPTWERIAREQFQESFQLSQPRQSSLPSLSHARLAATRHGQ
jgi:hypothetical protein